MLLLYGSPKAERYWFMNDATSSWNKLSWQFKLSCRQLETRKAGNFAVPWKKSYILYNKYNNSKNILQIQIQYKYTVEIQVFTSKTEIIHE